MYKKEGINEWNTTKREETIFYDENGKKIEDLTDYIFNKKKYESRKEIVERYEGYNTDYWKPTAANAIKPLYQLMTLAKMRPDCIWDGD